VRLGLAYVKGAATAEMNGLVARARARGPFAASAISPPAPGSGASRSKQLAWTGACDGCSADSSGARPCGQLGIAAAAEKLGDGDRGERREGTQLALELELPAARACDRSDRWQRLIADYSTSGRDDRRSRDGDLPRAPDGGQARHQRPARAAAERL